MHKSFTQEKLAEQSTVRRLTIIKIEKKDGPCSCRKHTLDQLAKALGIEPSDLNEDSFKRVVDIGDDIELHLDRVVSGQQFVEESKKLARLIDMRTRVLRQ